MAKTERMGERLCCALLNGPTLGWATKAAAVDTVAPRAKNLDPSNFIFLPSPFLCICDSNNTENWLMLCEVWIAVLLLDGCQIVELD
jgi:hypothetical protein